MQHSSLYAGIQLIQRYFYVSYQPTAQQCVLRMVRLVNIGVTSSVFRDGVLYLIHSFNFLVAVQSLSGHTSAVESVGFDSTEVFVAAGAASGTIKLWDLEEAKSMQIQIFNLLLICGQYKYMYESLSNCMLYLLAHFLCSCPHSYWT